LSPLLFLSSESLHRSNLKLPEYLLSPLRMKFLS
jgi:hypothetical protein